MKSRRFLSVALITWGFLAASGPAPGETDASRLIFERFNAEQQRELDREQRRYLEGIDRRLPLLEERQIKRRLEEQKVRQRQLQDRQIREQSVLQQRLRSRPEQETVRRQAEQLQRFQLEQQRQQNQFRIEQNTWGYR